MIDILIHDKLVNYGKDISEELEFVGIDFFKIKLQEEFNKLIEFRRQCSIKHKEKMIMFWKEIGPYDISESDIDESLPFVKKESFGSFYHGQLKHDMKHGLGRFTSMGIIYEGEFKNDKKCGKGRQISDDISNN